MNKRKKKTTRLLAFLIASALLASCKKEQTQPTPLTSYNMSAYANSELLTFNANFINSGDSNITIQGVWVTNINETYDLNLYLLNARKGFIGTYSLGLTTGSALYHTYPTYSVSAGYLFQYQTDATHTGSFSITAYDSINKTISGTFNFTGVGGAGANATSQSSYPSTINITNGVFTKIPLSQ